MRCLPMTQVFTSRPRGGCIVGTRSKRSVWIEWIIAGSLLAVVLWVGIPNFIRLQKHANEMDAHGNARVIVKVLDRCAKANHGFYPFGLDGPLWSDNISDLLKYLPDGKLLKNPGTGQPTEPSRWIAWKSIPYATTVETSPDRRTCWVITNNQFGFPTDTLVTGLKATASAPYRRSGGEIGS